MIKKLMLFTCVFLPLRGNAADLALNFQAIPLVQFAQSTYKAMLNRDYVIAPELLAADKPISVSVRNIKSGELAHFVEEVLSAQGVKSELRNGVYFLSLRNDHIEPPFQSSSQSSIRLTGPVSVQSQRVIPGNYSANTQHSELASDASVSAGACIDEFERYVFKPTNRKAEYIAGVLNAVFQSRPASSAPGVVIFTASKTMMPKIQKLASEIDDISQKVKISATFVEVSTTDSNGLGVSVIMDILGAKLGIKVGDASSGSLTLRTGGFQAVIDAISADGRFKQVAAPTAVLDDNEKSKLSFGDSVPTISSTTMDRQGNAVQQVQYQESGVLLDVQPSVLGSGRINVKVDGQVSSFSATTTGVAGSPTLSKRQVTTSVTVEDGELLVVGGLNNNRVVNNRSGLSFLPKSWAGNSNADTSTDLVLILSATVVK